MVLVEARLENGPFAAREARHQIARVQDSLPAPVRADVTLLVSELVTNAFRHSGQPTSDPILLRVEVIGGTVRIEVTDMGAGGSPAIREAGADGGWGLRIVEEVADRWGTTRTPSGTVVWFELEAVT